jgi:membrane associated rhomboid family serine protease
MNQITPTVKQLLIINVILFIATEFLKNIELINILAIYLKNTLALYYIGNPNFRFWQLITHMFMHGSITHIAFNMFSLYSFGSFLERFWGGKKFLFFYISCGLGAAGLQLGIIYFTNGDPNGAMVGASGAIYGLLAAFAFLYPDAELAMFFIPLPIKAKYFVPLLVAFDIYSGLTGGGNIAHFAHVGGATLGILMMLYWKKNQFNNNRWN